MRQQKVTTYRTKNYCKILHVVKFKIIVIVCFGYKIFIDEIYYEDFSPIEAKDYFCELVTGEREEEAVRKFFSLALTCQLLSVLSCPQTCQTTGQRCSVRPGPRQREDCPARRRGTWSLAVLSGGLVHFRFLTLEHALLYYRKHPRKSIIFFC